jgi:hypothetical protein
VIQHSEEDRYFGHNLFCQITLFLGSHTEVGCILIGQVTTKE